MFATLDRQSPDALLSVIAMHRADTRGFKIDLGVGVYRNEQGVTPIMSAVKTAETQLLAEQRSKGYLGSEGDQRFTDLLAGVAFGWPLSGDPRITGVQTPGGTGALRLAAALLARSHRPPVVWTGAPTWPNHAPIFEAAGLTVRTLPFFDQRRADLDFDAFYSALSEVAPGDVVLLHGCCHNPTGAAFSTAQWRELVELFERHGLVPLIDLAYQGLGTGLEEDAAGTRAMLAAVPEALIAYSCDKNFGLYRDRVGALWVQSSVAATTDPVRDTLLLLARSLWSMPPDHGAAAVRIILDDPKLTAEWRTELEGMRGRIAALRVALGTSHPRLAPIAFQQGMFALLPIDSTAVATLRREHAIYMADSGRINVAGLTAATIPPFVTALAPFLASIPEAGLDLRPATFFGSAAI
ncbi:aspartate/tyrosine/aromatic aminotransferase [Sphingomonas sp. UV9]|nr:aspartate/tyrosine/aromatic aminotransferase [Sphingomonas sp. UV9]